MSPMPSLVQTLERERPPQDSQCLLTATHASVAYCITD